MSSYPVLQVPPDTLCGATPALAFGDSLCDEMTMASLLRSVGDSMLFGNRSLGRIVLYHLCNVAVSLWVNAVAGLLVAVVFVMGASHVVAHFFACLAIILRCPSNGLDVWRKAFKAVMQAITVVILVHVQFEMIVRNVFDTKRYVSPTPRPPPQALREHACSLIVYFIVWKPIVSAIYSSYVVYTWFPLDSTMDLWEIFFSLLVEAAIFYVLAWIMGGATQSMIVPLFQSTSDQVYVRQDSRKASAGPCELPPSDELYCIPVPPPPFVENCDSQHETIDFTGADNNPHEGAMFALSSPDGTDDADTDFEYVQDFHRPLQIGEIAKGSREYGRYSSDVGNAWLSPRSYQFIQDRRYDILSPTTNRNPRSSQVFRGPHIYDEDPVHFVAYAPPAVRPYSTFTYAIWAFLVHQRNEVHDLATSDDPFMHQLSRERLMHVRRGALAHVTLRVPQGFEIENGPVQSFEWNGDVTSVKYNVQWSDAQNVFDGQVLFEATIVVGSSVVVLKSFVVLSLAAQTTREDIMSELTSESEVLPATFEEIPYHELHIKELVGQGHFGDAFRADYHGRDVVVKTVRAKEFGENMDQVVQEFRHEAAVLNMFGRHPNIVPFVGASTDSSQPLTLVTEYLPFGSLEERVQRGDVSSRDKQVLLFDAAAGVLNMHEGRFIHRDVAARNVLVDASVRGKVCDFGLCRRVGSSGCVLSSGGVGPLKYMAPESLVPPHVFSYASDVYAFGVLMWETWSGVGPFAGVSGAEAAALVLEGHRLSLDVIPSEYKGLLASCFDEDPSKRPHLADIHRELGHTTLDGHCT